MIAYRPRSDKLERRLLFGVGLIGAFMFSCLVAGVWQFWLLQGSLARQVVLAGTVVAQRDRLFQFVNQETGVRGYVATSDPHFLDIYYRATPVTQSDSRALLRSIAGDPSLQQRVAASLTVSAAVQRYLASEIALVRAGKVRPARAGLARGKVLFDRLRAVDERLAHARDVQLLQQREHTQFLARTGIAGGLLLCGLFLACAAGFAALWHRARHYRLSSYRDPLTGASNRRGAIAAIETHLSGSQTQPFGLVFIDLDGFKKINDVYGHAMGDAILQSVAARVQRELRESDVVCRLGGDEFVCVIAPPSKSEQVNAIADRLRKSVSKPYTFDADFYVVGCSVGTSLYPDHGEGAAALLARADQAMYADKTRGARVGVPVPAAV